MVTIRNSADAVIVADDLLRALIEARFASLQDDVLCAISVCEDGDGAHHLQQLLGFSPLENRFDGSRFGEADFHPSFELIEEHETCFELVFVLSDDGQGVLVFIPKTVDVDPQLLALCHQYAVRAQET